MTAPKDRAALIEALARDQFERSHLGRWPESPADTVRCRFVASAAADLAAIEAAGCVVVPVVPTERMVERLRVSMNGVGGTLQTDLAVTIAASPYRKEPT